MCFLSKKIRTILIAKLFDFVYASSSSASHTPVDEVMQEACVKCVKRLPRLLFYDVESFLSNCKKKQKKKVMVKAKLNYKVNVERFSSSFIF